MHRHVSMAWKAVVAIAWLVLVFVSFDWFRSLHIPVRHLPNVLRGIIHSYGALGPVVLIACYALRTFLFIPTSVLLIVGGAVYGPVGGFFLGLVGESVTAWLGFAIGRFFGRDFVAKHASGVLGAYDHLLTDQGFLTILFMRLLFFPFDVVNLVSGTSGILFRQYALATALGVVPGILGFSSIGSSLGSPHAVAYIAVLIGATILLAFLLRRIPWVKRHLLSKPSRRDALPAPVSVDPLASHEASSTHVQR